jgi:hypothetical protein
MELWDERYSHKRFVWNAGNENLRAQNHPTKSQAPSNVTQTKILISYARML